MWFYPNSGSGIVNKMVAYNYLDSSKERPVWTSGTLARTAWRDSAVFGKPHATEYDANGTTATSNKDHVYGNQEGTSTYFEHETGLDQIKEGATTAIAARFVPDFLSQTGDAIVTLNLRDYSNDSQTSSALGPFTISSSTTKVDTRARARAISLKVANTSTGQFWKLGTFRLDIQPDGRR